MDQNNTSPVPPPAMPNGSMGMPMGSDHSKKLGPIMATFVIVIILVAAGLYIFASQMNKQQPPTTTTPANLDINTQVRASQQSQAQDQTPAPSPTIAPVTSKSTDVNSLQADLNASTNGLDGQNF